MIKVRVERPVNEDIVYVWICEMRTGFGWAVFRPETDDWNQIEGGFILSSVPPSLKITEEMLKALAEAALPRIVPQEVVERHLNDAIVVRDRMINIIEKANGIPPMLTVRLENQPPTRP